MSSRRRQVHFNPSAASWITTSAPSAHIFQFHRRLPRYEPTPLISLPDAAREIGVGQIHVKSEADRLGLPSFKILGASWATFRSLAEKLSLPLDSRIETVRDAAAAAAASSSSGSEFRVYCATEGNHGRAVARMASILGVAAEVHVPGHAHPVTVELIRSEGATVVVSRGNYDDAVLEATEASAKNESGILVQDYAYGDYLQIPQWIVDGYLTMMWETDEQLGGMRADLVVAPVGVGSFAQAVVSYFKQQAKASSVLAVEPDTAACLWKSLEKGKLTSVPTTSTIMAGLNCGAPSVIAWDVLKSGVDASLTVSDYEAHQAALYLQAQGVAAGPCGSSTLAALRRLTAADKSALGLGEESTVVIFCTEGARQYDAPHDVSSDDPAILTRTLVQIDSTSPSLGSVPGSGETRMAEYVSAWLEHRHLETHWVEPTEGQPSVVKVARGTGEGKSHMFDGFIDTVTLQGYDGDPLDGKVVHGRHHSRGAADVKAGLAAMMGALSSAETLNL
ncbi:Threonine dehydratase [Geosmithia morbida]|uniref:Threonine dehydratase n=1 Tax=Geosmithia morbida TaxID=1094350 RepID=A0A9P4YXL6_9HYPO|nr:Threonine dehydratase [Geosmithia morbida]KAF4124725.1 Threonine dehydratase [Geosmithia morbida]